MTPEEARAELGRLFSGPQPPPGKDRWHHLQYDLVRLQDGKSASSGTRSTPRLVGPSPRRSRNCSGRSLRKTDEPRGYSTSRFSITAAETPESASRRPVRKGSIPASCLETKKKLAAFD